MTVDVGPRPPVAEWSYLGDGVYVSFDGYQLMLRANNYHNANTIYLEPSVFGSLVDYAKRTWGTPAGLT